MKQVLTSLLLVLLLFSAPQLMRAQDNNSLETKEKILDKLKTDKGDLEKKIAAVEADIAAMKPVKNWKYGGFGAINLNQAAFVNWAAGGSNSIAFTAVGNLYTNYKKKNLTWDNTIDASWGMLYSKRKFRKNEDRFELNSKLGYAVHKHVSIAALIRFNTQFSPTYNYSSNDGVYPLQAYFAAPAYLTMSLGIDYKPTSYFSLYVSPAAGKFTFVQPDPNIHEWNYGLDTGKVFRAEYGALLRATLNKEIVKNVSIWTQLDLFNNFTDKDKGNRKNIDIDWQTRINLKISKYITASLYAQVLYDHNTGVQVTKQDASGPPYTIMAHSKVQFREALGVGLSYKFTSKD